MDRGVMALGGCHRMHEGPQGWADEMEVRSLVGGNGQFTDETIDSENTLPGARSGPAMWVSQVPRLWANRSINGGWNRRRIILPIITGVLLVVALFALVAGVVHARQPFLTTQRVTQGNITVSFNTTGSVHSAIYDADFVVQGKIAEIDVKVGQQVAAGDTLAKLDDGTLKDGVAQAQAAYSGAQSVLSSAQSNQNQVDAAANAMSDAAFDQEQKDIAACNNGSTCLSAARSKYSAAVAQADAMRSNAQQLVNQAQANVNTAKAALQVAQDNQGNATLKAAHAGTIAAINGHIGGQATGNQQPFMQIYDLTTLQVTGSVNQDQVGNIQTGDTVRFTVATYKGDTYRGTVTGVSPIGQVSGNDVVYPVSMDVDAQSLNPSHSVLPGMRANVTIITAQRFGVRLIPVRAVTFAHDAATRTSNRVVTTAQVTQATQDARQQLLELQNQSAIADNEHPEIAYVLVYVGNKWVAKGVVLGVTDGRLYEVLSGLSKGDKIATGDEQNWLVVLRGQQ